LSNSVPTICGSGCRWGAFAAYVAAEASVVVFVASVVVDVAFVAITVAGIEVVVVALAVAVNVVVEGVAGVASVAALADFELMPAYVVVHAAFVASAAAVGFVVEDVGCFDAAPVVVVVVGGVEVLAVVVAFPVALVMVELRPLV